MVDLATSYHLIHLRDGKHVALYFLMRINALSTCSLDSWGGSPEIKLIPRTRHPYHNVQKSMRGCEVIMYMGAAVKERKKFSYVLRPLYQIFHFIIEKYLNCQRYAATDRELMPFVDLIMHRMLMRALFEITKDHLQSISLCMFNGSLLTHACNPEGVIRMFYIAPKSSLDLRRGYRYQCWILKSDFQLLLLDSVSWTQKAFVGTYEYSFGCYI